MQPIRIVGNGLAAHVLAQTLIQRGLEVEVFAADFPGAASKAAWGLLNPVHLKTRTLTYGALGFELALAFYSQCQERLDAHFMEPVVLRHYFRDESDNTRWIQAWQEGLHQHIHCGDTYVDVLRAASISIPHFLSASQQDLERRGYWRNAVGQEAELMNVPVSNWVIWAQGVWACSSSLFGWVPLRPSAGVQVEWNQPSSEFQPLVVHRGFFLGQDPANPSVHRLGSTYSWSQTPADHAQAEQELIQALPSYPEAQPPTALKFSLGYRPASGDRKPIVGHHPEFRNHLFFNGLGSKGLLLAPQLADLMADICVHSPREIPPEINIARFYKRFKSSP